MRETISRGPQFKGIVSTLGLVMFAFGLILTIATVATEYYTVSVMLFILTVVGLSLFLDVRGTQIDYAGRKIRPYKEFLFMKYGDWILIDGYQSVELIKDTFYVRHPMIGVNATQSSTRISSFDVILKNYFEQNTLLLSEFEKHAEAVTFMHHYAEKFKLPSKDVYKTLQNSAVARRKNSGRR